MSFIPDNMFDEYYSFIDELYSNNFISEKVTISYINKSNCPNCIPGNPNKYISSGPIPFSFGPCPYCDGKNFIETETTEDIKLRIYETPRIKGFDKVSNTEINNTTLMVIGKMENLHKIKKCDHMLIFSNTEYSDWKFVLDSEPVPFGFGSSQFKCYIKRL